MRQHLSVQQRQQVRKLRNEGRNVEEIARLIGCAPRTVWRVNATIGKRELMNLDRAEQAGIGALELASRSWCPGAARLTLADREEISRGLSMGETLRSMARRLDRAPSTISREVRRCQNYRAVRAHHRAYVQARRPKTAKLAAAHLRSTVETWLQQWWSPQEIARRLRVEHPHDRTMRVSHETIYQALFVQGRGELRRELHRCLRTGRARRRTRNGGDNRGRIPHMVMISERPAEADDRAVPGHWEGDLIIGKGGKSAVGTLVERTTRFVVLLHLPHGREAEKVNQAMKAAISTLPASLMRSITWDQGKELASHASFTVDTGVQIYFCDPHSPWQRGSNENTNGLLRQYMPKSTDLSAFSPGDLAQIAASLNNRPRKTLGYMKPSERLTEASRISA